MEGWEEGGGSRASSGNAREGQGVKSAEASSVERSQTEETGRNGGQIRDQCDRFRNKKSKNRNESLHGTKINASDGFRLNFHLMKIESKHIKDVPSPVKLFILIHTLFSAWK